MRREKLPWASVVAPSWVPETITVAPGTGSPFSVFTLPWRVKFWAEAYDGEKTIAARSAQKAMIIRKSHFL